MKPEGGLRHNSPEPRDLPGSTLPRPHCFAHSQENYEAGMSARQSEWWVVSSARKVTLVRRPFPRVSRLAVRSRSRSAEAEQAFAGTTRWDASAQLEVEVYSACLPLWPSGNTNLQIPSTFIGSTTSSNITASALHPIFDPQQDITPNPLRFTMPTSSSAATSSSSAMGSRAPLKSVDEKGVSFQFRVGGACWQATIMHRNTQ